MIQSQSALAAVVPRGTDGAGEQFTSAHSLIRLVFPCLFFWLVLLLPGQSIPTEVTSFSTT